MIAALSHADIEDFKTLAIVFLIIFALKSFK